MRPFLSHHHALAGRRWLNAAPGTPVAETGLVAPQGEYRVLSVVLEKAADDVADVHPSASPPRLDGLMIQNSPQCSSHIWLAHALLVLVSLLLSTSVLNADETAELDFFENKIRPVLVERCYSCHSADAAKAGKLKGDLQLDTRQGTRAGGESGPAVTPGDLDDSLLISAIQHESFEMPPKEKLPKETIADFVRWVEMGAPDPRDGAPVAYKKEIDYAAARQHWAYQPVKVISLPSTKNGSWAKGDLDRYVLGKIEAIGLQPAAEAVPTAVLRRLTFAITGLPPTPAELAEFETTAATGLDQALAVAVDRLLASARQRRIGDPVGRICRFHTRATGPASSTCQEHSMKVITMTAYRRPQYTREVLDALAQCDGIGDWTLLPNVEPGNAEVIAALRDFKACECRLVVNERRLGLNRNTLATLMRAFHLKADHIVHLEDDTVPSPDALRYFEWGIDHLVEHDPKHTILLVSGYNKPKSEPTPDQSHLCDTRQIWTPWGWGVDRKRLVWLMTNWCTRNPKCFTCNFRSQYQRTRKELFPVLSRIQNIGYELGENQRTAEWYRANHRTPWVAFSTKQQPFTICLS